ncbi:MAG TPA: hypothetical protein VHC69_19610 [Polyangiaceae bacterium]|nr:hypothetical protein [Polyangiaceae bacterium]
MMNRIRSLQAIGLSSYLRLVHHSSRVILRGDLAESGLLTTWHDSLLVGLALAADRPSLAVYVLEREVQTSVICTLEALGLHVIRAREDNALGARAVRDWVRHRNHHVVITLDGTSNFPRVAQSGVARLARLAGAPLYPVRLAAAYGFESEPPERCFVPDVDNVLEATILGKIAAGTSSDEATAALQRALGTEQPRGTRRPKNLRTASSRLWARACMVSPSIGSLRIGARAHRQLDEGLASTAWIASTSD